MNSGPRHPKPVKTAKPATAPVEPAVLEARRRKALPKALSQQARAGGRIGRPAGGRTVVAVLGSVAALGGAPGSAVAATPTAGAGHRPPRTARRADPLPAGELAVLGLVFATLSAAAPAIARPLLDRGVAASTITAAEAGAFLARLTGSDSGDRVDSPGAASDVDSGAPALFRSVFAAIRSQLPRIAAPLVNEALEAGTITPGQATRITQRMAIRAEFPIGLAGGYAEPHYTGRLP